MPKQRLLFYSLSLIAAIVVSILSLRLKNQYSGPNRLQYEALSDSSMYKSLKDAEAALERNPKNPKVFRTKRYYNNLHCLNDADWCRENKSVISDDAEKAYVYDHENIESLNALVFILVGNGDAEKAKIYIDKLKLWCKENEKTDPDQSRLYLESVRIAEVEINKHPEGGG